MIRSTIVLPNGTGKNVKVAAFVSDDKRDEATAAGADVVGGKSDLLKEIQDGKLDFDVLVTTPDQMRDLAPVAKVLGPRGMMPSPKAGTVSPNLAESIEAIKKGRIEFRLDKTGNIHAILGKISFDEAKLVENTEALIKAVMDNKPVGVKGKLVKKAVISSTMSPGIQIELTE
jgi:large subunit ribosomal protein L1